MADYVYLLNKGEVVFVGEPGELDGEDLFARCLGHAAWLAVRPWLSGRGGPE